MQISTRAVQENDLVAAKFDINKLMLVKYIDALTVYCEWWQYGEIKTGAFAIKDIVVFALND